MGLLKLVVQNLRRSPLRSAMTLLAVAISLVAFLLLRSLSAGYTERVRQTPDNRVVSRHKMGWDQDMPVHYVEVVRSLPGVKQAMGGKWEPLKLAGKETDYFHVSGIQAKPFVEMHYELSAPSEHKQAFVQDRQGVMVSDDMAEEHGWQLGDRITLQGRTRPIELELNIRTIFHSTRHGYGQRSVFFHWEYLNEALPENERDRVGVISAEIHDPSQGARIAKAVDIHFDKEQHQTFTMEDQALNAALVGRFGALLEAMDVISLFVLGVVLLILGNTVSMSVRERTHEFAVLRAIGFLPRHIAGFVLGEACLLGLAGGALGFALAYPLVELPISRYLEESMGFLPLQVPTGAAFAALFLGGLLGVLAAGIPAYGTMRLEVTASLRQVG